MTQLFRPDAINRRQVLRGAGVGLTGAGAALLFGCGGDDKNKAPAATPSLADGEPPPEVTTIRFPFCRVACTGPLLTAKPFLEQEGFTDVEYTALEANYRVLGDHIAPGRLDMGLTFAAFVDYASDQGAPLVVLGAAHAACWELRAANEIQSVSDLRGKRVGFYVRNPSPGDYTFITSVLKHVGLNPGTDVELIPFPPGGLQGGVFDSGQIEAMWSLVPEALGQRDTYQGHVLMESKHEAPWDQNLCCVITTNRTFFETNPVATKRATRAILRAIDRCAAEPEAVAQEWVNGGWAPNYYTAMETLKMLRYDTWRTYDPAAALTFYALRLREAGLIESTPDEILDRVLELESFNELKQEMAFAPGLGPLRASLLNCETNVAGPLAWAPEASGTRQREERS